jgi:hypothetical protein
MKNTKFYLLTAIFFMAILSSSAQDDNEPRYLIGDNMGKVHVSGFGAYTIGFSEVNDNLAVYNGGSGAVLLNQTFYFGGYGTGLSTAHRRNDIAIKTGGNVVEYYSNLRTGFGHGGFLLGYIHQSHKPVHFGVSTKLGWGAVSLTEDYTDNSFNDYGYYNIVSDNVFVVNPQLEVELNMLRWFKINASAGYQFVTGIDQTYINADGQRTQYFGKNDFNKPVFNLSFVFGGFGGKR